MKRMMFTAVSAVAAAAAFAAPASAQVLTTKPIVETDMTAPCLTPVTKCVDQYADYAVELAMYYYNVAGEAIKNGPDIGAVCELIWEDGCGTDAVPF